MDKYTEPVIRVRSEYEFEKLGKYCKDTGLGWLHSRYSDNKNEYECIRVRKTPLHASYSFYINHGFEVTEFKDI